jgi:D-threo-aldose 1-dehydrogenase
MKRRQIGRTSLEVDALGFGAAQIGNLYSVVQDGEANEAVDAAWDAGLRYFDTAPHYGLGLSERRLGAALAGRPRDQFVVSTKVGRLLEPNPSPSGSDLGHGGFAVHDGLTRVYDYSRDGVLRSLESSLERLQLDRVDIVYVHDPDDHMDDAIGQAIPALVELRDAGVVGAIGAGMNFWPPLHRIVQESDVDVVMLAGRWTLLDRSGEPLLAECERRHVSVVAAAPFNSGILSRPWPAEGARFDYSAASPELLGRARTLAAICQDHRTSLPEAAMQFPLRHPAVACVVAGMRTAGQARSSVGFMQADIPEALWPRLDEVVTASPEVAPAEVGPAGIRAVETGPVETG